MLLLKSIFTSVVVYTVDLVLVCFEHVLPAFPIEFWKEKELQYEKPALNENAEKSLSTHSLRVSPVFLPINYDYLSFAGIVLYIHQLN